MKTSLYALLAAFLLCSSMVIAQPTITATTAGTVGDEFSFDFVEADGFDPGASGADVTWDFADITLDGTSNNYTFVTPASTGHGDLFPGSNVAAEQGGGNFVYYKINASEWSLYGVYTVASTLAYSDPETYFSFPMTYGSTFSDDLHCEYFAGVETIRDGSVTVEADGYGTLKLPGGNYDNVLRVVLHEVYSDEFTGIPFPSEYDFTHYYWLKEGTKGPLFQYSYLEVGGIVPSVTETASINANISGVGIEGEAAAMQINVFPNPATNEVHLNMGNARVENIVLYDITGRVVDQVTSVASTGIVTINTQSFPAGVYVVKAFTADAGVCTAQFQVMR